MYENYGKISGFTVPMYNVVTIGGYEAVREVLANEDCQGRPDVCLLRDRFKTGGHYGKNFMKSFSRLLSCSSR